MVAITTDGCPMSRSPSAGARRSGPSRSYARGASRWRRSRFRGAIATTFWGKAWCDNLEGYSDYANRLPRGRTYVRNGSVIDLQIKPGRVAAQVIGSDLYDVAITVKETVEEQWRAIGADCAGASIRSSNSCRGSSRQPSWSASAGR